MSNAKVIGNEEEEKKGTTGNNKKMDREFLVPSVFSILGTVATLVFILFYTLYWSKGFSLYENIIVTIVSLVVAVLLIGLMWMVWGIRQSNQAVGTNGVLRVDPIGEELPSDSRRLVVESGVERN